MTPELVAALQEAQQIRREVLRGLGYEDRLTLIEELFRDFFVEQRAALLKWAALTGQSAQVDTGYIAQHVASLVLLEPGQGFKGKGDDLADGSEVKSAAILSGVDRPRWNHDLGTIANDGTRRDKGLPPKWEVYLNSPVIFYLLFDRSVGEDGQPGDGELRVRAWCVDVQRDEAWRDLVLRFIEQRGASQYNLQLHPPVGYDDDIVVNTLGNLDFAEIKVLEAQLRGIEEHQEFELEWTVTPPESIIPVVGRTTSLPWGGRTARPSRLNPITDVRPDLDQIAQLAPSIDLDSLSAATSTDEDVQRQDAEG